MRVERLSATANWVMSHEPKGQVPPVAPADATEIGSTTQVHPEIIVSPDRQRRPIGVLEHLFQVWQRVCYAVNNPYANARGNGRRKESSTDKTPEPSNALGNDAVRGSVTPSDRNRKPETQSNPNPSALHFTFSSLSLLGPSLPLQHDELKNTPRTTRQNEATRTRQKTR